MELSYLASCQEMGLAGNLLYPNDTLSSAQLYYENSTDYLFTSPLSISTAHPIYGTNAASQLDSVSGTQLVLYPPPTICATNFQPNSIEAVPYESSVFLSPQTSASSSAAHSPQSESHNAAASFDLGLDEFFDVDDILNNSDIISDDLLDVLNDVGSSDFLNQLEIETAHSGNFDSGSSFASDSSVSSTPKRKYSTDSSDCSSLDSFETSSTTGSNKKPKRARHSRTNQEERVTRKKDQNKRAASRYRNKKKSEMHSCEQTLEELESHRDSLSEQVKKLQTEFNVILPLATAAFTFDPIRRQHLANLLSRISNLL